MDAAKEMIKGLLENETEFDKELDEWFAKFDANGNGVLEKSEMKNVITAFFEKIGEAPPTEEKIAELVSKMDTNSDDVVSKEELKAWVVPVFKKLCGL